MMSDLDRFLVEQALAYEDALGERTEGRKDGHWFWFILPQLVGLGRIALRQ